MVRTYCNTYTESITEWSSKGYQSSMRNGRYYTTYQNTTEGKVSSSGHQLTSSSYDARNTEAGPSYKYVDSGYSDILPEFRHTRSQSRMVLIEPLRTTTQTKVWLDQYYRNDDDAEKGSIRSSSSGDSMDKVDLNSGLKEEEDEEVKGMPFLIRPLPANSGVDEDDKTADNGALRWLRTEDQATEWLSLFYGKSQRAAIEKS